MQGLHRRVQFGSFAEMEDFTLDLLRRLILSQGQKDFKLILSERIEQWKLRVKANGR